nr:endonuclease/exonuclease/phosphatase family protein [uncultured Draconibacterium sp.]
MDTIKILSWNVEHFKTDKVQEVADIIKSYQPDVFGIYEVEANRIYNFMLQHFPEYALFLTEGQQKQEILVACRNTFQCIKFQQKKEFKSGNPALRPGAFLTFKHPQRGIYNFLFLHTDSGSTAVDFGNRTEMFEHAYNLKRKLDYDNNSEVNFVMLGDLNTMGLKYPRPFKSDKILETENEMVYLDFWAERKAGSKKHQKLKPNVRRLSKPVGTYYSKTYGISDLDHIVASKHLKFVPQDNYSENNQQEIKLDGWRKFLNNPNDLDKFVEEISDHCLLFCELIVE